MSIYKDVNKQWDICKQMEWLIYKDVNKGNEMIYKDVNKAMRYIQRCKEMQWDIWCKQWQWDRYKDVNKGNRYTKM